MIEIENVSKHFVSRDRDRVAALTNVSLSIRPQRVRLPRRAFGLREVDAAAAGRRAAARRPRAASSIDGRPVAEPRAETGIVFQSPTLLPWASVLDNVLFPLKMMKRVTRDSPPAPGAC